MGIFFFYLKYVYLCVYIHTETDKTQWLCVLLNTNITTVWRAFSGLGGDLAQPVHLCFVRLEKAFYWVLLRRRSKSMGYWVCCSGLFSLDIIEATVRFALPQISQVCSGCELELVDASDSFFLIMFMDWLSPLTCSISQSAASVFQKVWKKEKKIYYTRIYYTINLFCNCTLQLYLLSTLLFFLAVFKLLPLIKLRPF